MTRPSGANRSKLRALDDSFDRLLRRHGTSLMGDHPGAGPSRYRFVALAVVVVVVAVARLVGGDAPGPVLLGAVIFALGYGLVLRSQSRLGKVENETTQHQMALRRFRIWGLVMVGMAGAFALAGIWEVAGLLLFLAVFFTGAVWAADRYGKPPTAPSA